MNSKSVLQRIMTLLSTDEVVKFTEAQTKDGTILESPTFDLGEPVEVIAEDGTKTPAPDGEHEIALRDSEGNEVVIRVVTKDGKITERENVEEAESEVGDETEMAEATIETAKGLPNTTEEPASNTVEEEKSSDPLIQMAYRIDELETKMAEMTTRLESAFPKEGTPEVSSLQPIAEELESDLPKLDGAPIEQLNKFSQVETNKKNFGKKETGYHNSVLSKLNNF